MKKLNSFRWMLVFLLVLLIIVLFIERWALAQMPRIPMPPEEIAGWEFNAGPGKGAWNPNANRAEYPTLRDCEEALAGVMMNAPQPWPPGIRCAPYRKTITPKGVK